MIINKKLVTISSLVLLLPILLALFLWQSIPEQIATRFDLSGQVVHRSSKIFAIFGVPAILLLTHLLVILGISRDSNTQKAGQKMQLVLYWLVPLISLVMQTSLILSAAGIIELSFIAMLVYLVLGLAFIFLGNYLPKVRYNQTVGIKLPWTLASEENWDKAHRLTGKLWVFGGVLTLFLSLFGQTGIWLLMVVLALILLIPIVYSYRLSNN